ncbi:MAG: hypothetical protein ABIQ31_21675 [Ferruginibacter sp.]
MSGILMWRTVLDGILVTKTTQGWSPAHEFPPALVRIFTIQFQIIITNSTLQLN